MIHSVKAISIKLHEGGPSHSAATLKSVVVQNNGYTAQIESCLWSSEDNSCVASSSTIINVYCKRFSGTTWVFLVLELRTRVPGWPKR